MNNILLKSTHCLFGLPRSGRAAELVGTTAGAGR